MLLWNRHNECIGCEGSGNRTSWLNLVSVLVCREHQVWLEEMFFTSQAYTRFRDAERAWQEYCAELSGGGARNDNPGRQVREAAEAMGAKVRQLCQMLRDQKPDLVANRRAEEDAEKIAKEPPDGKDTSD